MASDVTLTAVIHMAHEPKERCNDELKKQLSLPLCLNSKKNKKLSNLKRSRQCEIQECLRRSSEYRAFNQQHINNYS